MDDHLAAGSRFTGRSADQYRRALRHSARVRMLKIVVPTAALALAAALVFVSVLSRSIPSDIAVERTTFANGMIVMQNPVLTGQTTDAGTFTVNAQRAVQAIASPNVITLSAIAAELPVSSDETARVEAASGIYDRGAGTLTLDQPFRVMSSSGLEVDMQSAEFRISEGSMASDQPVEIRNGNTSLVAQTVRMQDNGQTIIFERDVRMTIDPSTLRNSQKDDD
jgi:lipopolysaccharide export system protein LptC